MEIKQLKAFIAIAEEKTFTAGAKRVNVTQAAVSMQIRQLEEEIGLPLFTRTPRRVILTEAGELLLERARRILREHDSALAELAEVAGAEHGRLRIGSASAMFATAQLPQILEKLKERFPNAEISVSSGTSKLLVEKILHGEMDIAFVSLPIETQNVQTELLYGDEVVAIAHPSHPNSKDKIISAAALAGESLILGEEGGNTRRMIDDFFNAANLKPNIVMELSRQEAINKMVENNMGVGIASAKSALPAVKEGKIVSWWIEGAEIKWNLGLARLRGGYFSPIAREFTEICRDNFAEREREFAASGRQSGK
ncbi:MAG: LysR family transcriptional regulator [Acidobacteria bacterium]|nr:MAG: LysR family transcriptional regulator [Acidobacteriota bacterium]REK01154.1 MAG: LysR family transcriptional regulator [Acidobacteriota bacterium]REK14110.1 MAG: LysR family transcriptional regulator [Acidobacteriota bacterium]REK44825.1 MAG: LysR family transcriptional regulator [Acidobacteriota bacterium]